MKKYMWVHEGQDVEDYLNNDGPEFQDSLEFAKEDATQVGDLENGDKIEVYEVTIKKVNVYKKVLIDELHEVKVGKK